MCMPFDFISSEKKEEEINHYKHIVMFHKGNKQKEDCESALKSITLFNAGTFLTIYYYRESSSSSNFLQFLF